MSWEQFLEINEVGPSWHTATFSGNKLMTTNLKELGEVWGKKPEKSLILHGEPGRGKTYYMFALIRDVLEHRPLHYIRYFKGKKLDDKLVEELKKYGSNAYFIKTLTEVPILFIDDFGLERDTDRLTRDMYDIIDTRLEWQRPVVLSTNFSGSQIEQQYGKRIFSRFKEYVWVQFEGEDLRGKKND